MLSMSKVIQVYDDAEEKVVDIPEDEVENITDMMRVFTGIQKVWYAAYKEKISEPNFISGLLRFAISFVKRGLDPNYIDTEPGISDDKSTISAKAEKIWESVGDKIIDIVEDITTSEDFLPTNVPKEIFVEEDRHVRNAIAYCFIARAFDIWTPKFWRSDAIAAKIREKDQAEAEKKSPVGSEAN
uniref:Uncharacterized protein n=1 Tax=uncultured marine thaumarchaeote KM3_65_H02 TaxID=1456226 RepID=A0A075HFW4_9ARCH|nr:hypothetical protein [uncultured marine thaumarchaeote KM3_65_H02]